MSPKKVYALPTSKDRGDQFDKKKQGLLGKLMPTSVIPAATSNAFLVVGSREQDECYEHKLHKFLLIAGALSIGMGVLGTVFRYVMDAILWDQKITRKELALIRIMDILSKLIVLAEFGLLVSATLVFIPFFTQDKWQSDHPDGPYYCNFGTVVFSAIFLGSCWVLFALTGAVYCVIIYIQKKYKTPVNK